MAYHSIVSSNTEGNAAPQVGRSIEVKPAKQFQAVVEKQYPAQNECAILRVVGHVAGTHDECWQQAKRITTFPILTFKELQNVSTAVRV